MHKEAKRKGHMRKIKQQILLVTLLPTTALILLLSAYLLTSRVSDLDTSFHDRGEAIVQQIAGAAIHGLFTHNYSGLELLAEETLNQHPDTYKIKISDAHDLMVVDLADREKEANAISSIFTAPVQTTRSTDELYAFPIDQPLPTEVNESGALEVGKVTLWLDKSAVVTKRRQIVSNTIFLTLSGLLISAILAAFLSSRIAKPLEQLTKATIQLRKGNLETRVNTEETGEIGELQRSFNTMAEEIALANENMQSRITQATRELNESMEILEIKNVELDFARQRAVDASRVKSEFLANMSHEIRTPMNGILGFINLLSKTELSRSQKEHLATIKTSAGNLLAIINDILDLSKLEAGKLVLEPEPFSLRNCIDNSIALLAPMAHKKQIELVSLVFNDVPDLLIGDQTRIAQIITNLVNNAIKFTNSGEVILRAMVEEEKAYKVRLNISISDTGIGIPVSEQENIFSAFSQGRHQKENFAIGTGLGLSICRRLAEAMDGNITVTSKPGEGSCFQVTLLLQRDPVHQQTEIRAETSGVNGLNALLVEPHQPSRAVLSNDLLTLGVRVTLQNEYSINIPSETEYDFVVIGIGSATLADEASLEVVNTLARSIRQPVLFLFSGPDHIACDKLCAQGARICRSKPIKRVVLKETLRKLTDKKEKPQQSAKQPLIERMQDKSNWLTGKKILAADDNPINLELIVHMLTSYGADVVTACNGLEAVENTLHEKPDLVLMDIHMPRMNGFEAAQKIRQRVEACPPIVALTADAMKQNREDIEQNGLDGYLIKPISEEKLKSVIGNLLALEFDSPLSRQVQSIKAVQQVESLEPVASELPIRDIPQALRIAGGSEIIANKLYSDLLKELPNSIERAKRLYTDNAWSELWQEVHRIDGGLAVCGVPALSFTVKTLQNAIKDKDYKLTAKLLASAEHEVNRLLENYPSG